ncbi:MAG: type II secretion system GspH family protein [Candidatus Omnitrophica bacterium]|nr:type II secretion system GspH family protein [Candidatus Omnitrophota bacterium]
MKKFKKGFTLLEVMIAIGIFGIVAIACLGNYLISLKNIKIVNDKIKILILSEQKIEELKIKNGEIKEKIGNFSDYPDYTWEIQVSDIVIYDTEEDLYLKPYKLIIEGPYNLYSTILPFLLKEK